MKNKQTIFVIGLATLWAAMIFLVSWSGYGFIRFARYQEHVSALKTIGMAFSEYHNAHEVLPIENQDDLWKGGWRMRLFDLPSMRRTNGSQEAFLQVLDRYALLVPAGSKWLEGEPQSYKDLKGKYGYPVVVVQIPKELLGSHCSALILDSEHQRLRRQDETEFPLTILRDMIGLRPDGTTILIPSDASAELILKILQKDDRF